MTKFIFYLYLLTVNTIFKRILICSARKFLPYSFCILSLILYSCQINKSETNNFKIIISETLRNRTIDNGNTQKHDKDCIGFYRNHFSPNTIKPEFFSYANINKLMNITDLTWEPLSTTDSIINFNHLFSDNKNKVVYLAEIVESIKKNEKILSLGSDDGFILWVNGDSIASIHKGRSTSPHSNLIPVTLNKGKNVFLYKIDQGDGGWSLYRKLITYPEAKEIITDRVAEIYSDIIATCILPDSSGHIEIKTDSRRLLDNFNNVCFSWINISDTVYNRRSASISYHAHKLPTRLNLPLNFDNMGILDISIVNEQNQIIYKEIIPILKKSTGSYYVNKLIQNNLSLDIKKDPIILAREDAIRELFANILYRDKRDIRTYSTRMKAHALLDLYLLKYKLRNYDTKLSGPRIQGYRSNIDNTIQTYRIFYPFLLDELENSEDSRKLTAVFVMHGEYNKDSNYWRGYEGSSHSLLAKRTSLSTKYQLILIMPHGRGIQNYLGNSREELPIIWKELQGQSNLDTSKVGMIVWSKGTFPILTLLQSPLIPIKKVALISPVVPTDENELLRIVQNIKYNHPKINWFIRHGLDDHDAPINNTRRFVEILNNIFTDIDYKEIPHSSHWNYLTDVEDEFYSTF